MSLVAGPLAPEELSADVKRARVGGAAGGAVGLGRPGVAGVARVAGLGVATDRQGEAERQGAAVGHAEGDFGVAGVAAGAGRAGGGHRRCDGRRGGGARCHPCWWRWTGWWRRPCRRKRPAARPSPSPRHPPRRRRCPGRRWRRPPPRSIRRRRWRRRGRCWRSLPVPRWRPRRRQRLDPGVSAVAAEDDEQGVVVGGPGRSRCRVGVGQRPRVRRAVGGAGGVGRAGVARGARRPCERVAAEASVDAEPDAGRWPSRPPSPGRRRWPRRDRRLPMRPRARPPRSTTRGRCRPYWWRWPGRRRRRRRRWWPSA